jgi:hypothetical protein
MPELAVKKKVLQARGMKLAKRIFAPICYKYQESLVTATSIFWPMIIGIFGSAA